MKIPGPDLDPAKTSGFGSPTLECRIEMLEGESQDARSVKMKGHSTMPRQYKVQKCSDKRAGDGLLKPEGGQLKNAAV